MTSAQNEARIAASNNADLCASIMAASGARFERDERAFLCLDDPLPYYPKVVTLDPNTTDKLNTVTNGVDSVKDSFSCLDANILGLKVAFEASWIWCETKRQDMPAHWVRIESVNDLADWHAVWRGNGLPTDQVIFAPACLDDPNLVFLARRLGTTIEAGCIANLSKDAVGLSNVFSVIPKHRQLYEEALAAVSTVGDGRPVVGYEQGEDLEAARLAGFREVGRLRVLIRKP